MPGDLVVAVTGASGAPYALRLLDVLLLAGRRVHVTLSPAAAQVIEFETGRTVSLDRFDALNLIGPEARPFADRLVYHHYMDFRAGIASGTFPTGGMAICPCSTGTLGAIAAGMSQNLIHRAADVHLKEGRKLVLVVRETPLNRIQLHNLMRCAEAGATILPAMPAFYTRPRTIQDMIDFVVGRICDQLGVEHELFSRWGGHS
ncbi:MAG: 3-octaprenyl-4-hydroxybenzoate carboxy-lyase [Gemmataceae bacterium]